MKPILYILLSLFLLVITSCSKQELPDTPLGYLSLEGLHMSTDTEVHPITRAVDARLKLEIWQGETLVNSYEAGAEELSKRIALPAGEYTLKAYSPNQAEAASGEAGVPIYSMEHAFTIVPDDVTLISLTVPQVNVGITITYSDEFKANFTNYFVTVYSPTGRTVKLSVANASGLYYFNIPADGGILHYTLTATNQDGEINTSAERTIPEEGAGLSAGNYNVQIDLAQ